MNLGIGRDGKQAGAPKRKTDQHRKRTPGTWGGKRVGAGRKRKSEHTPRPKRTPGTWGGKRRGAGRKRQSDRANVPHRTRPALLREGFSAVFVTIRVLPGVWNLRSERSFRVIKRALEQAANRFETHVLHFSVQGNHLHFVVESKSKRACSRAMQGLFIRLAKGMNRLMKRSGKVFRDRFHAEVIHSAIRIWRVVRYVTHNYHRHMAQIGKCVSPEFVDPYSSEAKVIVLPQAHALVFQPP